MLADSRSRFHVIAKCSNKAKRKNTADHSEFRDAYAKYEILIQFY